MRNWTAIYLLRMCAEIDTAMANQIKNPKLSRVINSDQGRGFLLQIVRNIIWKYHILYNLGMEHKGIFLNNCVYKNNKFDPNKTYLLDPKITAIAETSIHLTIWEEITDEKDQSQS